MARSDDYDTKTLLAIGIATIDGHAFQAYSQEKVEPGPNTMHMAGARLNSVARHPAQTAPHLEHVGWVSASGHLYSDAQHEDFTHVEMVPVYRLLESEGG